MHPLKLGLVHLLMAGAALAVSACTASPANSASAATPRCAASARTSGQAFEGAPVVLPSAAPHSLQLDRFYTLSGGCADQARSFVMERILFADGRVLAVAEDGALSAVDQPLTIIGPSVLSPSQAPRLDGATFVHAARVGPSQESRQGPGSYVGVWSAGGKSIVASFEIGADGQSSTPRRLLESDLPILGLGYFPSLDTPSGQLGVVQQASGEAVRLLNYQWRHPGIGL